MIWALNGNGYQGTSMHDINKSGVQLNAGIVYKFGNSNGTHNFTIAKLRDQAEIDGLNSQINSLRSNLNDKDAQLSTGTNKSMICRMPLTSATRNLSM